MKSRVALILILAALAVVAVVVIRYPSPRPPEPVPPVVTPESPTEVVVGYLEALYREDFEAAYSYLSAESQQLHPWEDFRRACGGGEMTVFDLGAVAPGPAENDQVVVVVPLLEDPAQAGFTTVREQGEWKVVYRSGAPWFPYP